MTIVQINIQGFKSFGSMPQELVLTSQLAVIHAENSQGKTSLAEACEFLYSGSVSRRQLAGGSPADFEGCLRNAHLDASVPVFVEFVIEHEGRRRALRRELVTDFEGASNCVTRLTLDGEEIASVEDAGLHVSHDPLPAPVLLEHALRYAMSAKPGERSEYFRAVVDAEDLEIVRSEIAALVSRREKRTRSPLLGQLESLREQGILGDLPSVPDTIDELTNELKTALAALVATETSEGVAERRDLQGLLTSATEELAVRHERVFPIRQLSPGPFSHPPLLQSADAGESTLDEELDRYRGLVIRVDQSVANVMPLLRAALDVKLPHLDEEHESVDCPLCGTEQGLTQARLIAIREQVANHEGLTRSGDVAGAKLMAEAHDLEKVTAWATKTLPGAIHWTPEQRTRYLAAAKALTDNPQPLAQVMQGIQALQESAEALREAVHEASEHVSHMHANVTRLQPLTDDDISRLQTFQRSVVAAIDSHVDVCRGTEFAVAETLKDLDEPLTESSSTQGWSDLIAVASRAEDVWGEIEAEQRAVRATSRLRAAERDIVKAIQAVLDARLTQMGLNIRNWWSLLRPDELTTFNQLARRGAGNRYLDLTAALVPEPDGDGVVRNALAVLSHSQLNALGLATFLARCQLLDSPLIVLDDPVPGSDREHRNTFAGPLVQRLLDLGHQVIIATHDSELAVMLRTFHSSVSLNEFGLTLMDPREGSHIVATNDGFESQMLVAQSQMHSPVEESRRAAGNALRIATERLAKDILVAERRSSGEDNVQLSDYAGKNLKELRPLVVEHSVQRNEPGLWASVARILNDADHDVPPPQPNDLKLCYNMLRQLKKAHFPGRGSQANSGASVNRAPSRRSDSDSH